MKWFVLAQGGEIDRKIAGIGRVERKTDQVDCCTVLRGANMNYAHSVTRRFSYAGLYDYCSIAPRYPCLWYHRSRALGYLARLGLAYFHLQILTLFRST
jgi:hypothetical protein